MTNTANHQMTTVECACSICRTNAAKTGASFPMRAEITTAFAAILKGKFHEVVATAHQPGLKGGNPLVRAL